MKPAPFTYHRPDTLDVALALLAEHGDEAKVLAGGQSLGPMLNFRVAQPAHLIDINRLPGLDGVNVADGWVDAGALVRHHDLARSDVVRGACPLLGHAASTIGHYAIRQRGTLGGSLGHADPAAQLPLVAVLLGAEVVARSARGERRIPADAFFLSIMTTALEVDEIVTSVRFPALGADEGWGFELFSRRVGDFAIVAVGATVALDGAGTARRLRLAIGGAGPIPVRLDDVAGRFTGGSADRAWCAAVAQAAAEGCKPDDDPRIPAAYRRDLVGALTARALASAVGRGRKEAA